jgi:hypothetical protein
MGKTWYVGSVTIDQDTLSNLLECEYDLAFTTNHLRTAILKTVFSNFTAYVNPFTGKIEQPSWVKAYPVIGNVTYYHEHDSRFFDRFVQKGMFALIDGKRLRVRYYTHSWYSHWRTPLLRYCVDIV